MIELHDEIQTLFHYAQNSIHFVNKADKEMVEKIVSKLYSIEPFEKPDMILKLDDKLLAIEHFDFDASSFSRKGSLDRRKLADRNRNFDKMIEEADVTLEPIYFTTSVDCSYTATNYIMNFKTVFENHLSKVEEYKSRLISENKVKNIDDIIMCFFIVDNTPLGCYYNEDGPKSFVAVQVKECLELISLAKEINCFFFGYYEGNKYSIEFISNSPETIQIIKNIKVLDFKEDEFFAFDPQETRFCTQVER